MTSLITDLVKEIIIKELWDPTKRQLGYFICCERYVNELKTRVEELHSKKNDIENMRTQALRRREEPTEELKLWLKKVEHVEAVTKGLVDRVGEHKRCFTWISEMGSRYRMGKEAVKKKVEVDELLQKKLENMFLPAPTPSFENLPTGSFLSFGSTESAANEIMDALGDPGIHMIGIYGMGGVGKTTLAKYIMRQVKEKNMFDEVVMVTVSQNQSVVSIQEEMARSLEMNVKQENMTAQLYGRIKSAGKILIILDDMWGRLELSEVGIPEDDERCKIILTSRSLEVCNSMKSQKNVLLGVLSEDDSWKLFEENTVVIEQSIARDVASECRGLPLAIVTIGRALIRKSKTDWEAALDQLRANVPENIHDLERMFKRLKVSYDLLEGEETKSCFLFCSMFGEDVEIDVEDLTMYAMGEKFLKRVYSLQEARDRVKFLVNKLKASCLLLEGRSENYVKMHDVIRDMAIYIASDKKEGCLSKVCSGNQCWNEADDLKECRRLSILGNIIVPSSFLRNHLNVRKSTHWY